LTAFTAFGDDLDPAAALRGFFARDLPATFGLVLLSAITRSFERLTPGAIHLRSILKWSLSINPDDFT
jgi:hypothetical protein